jgi:hypothetical protein
MHNIHLICPKIQAKYNLNTILIHYNIPLRLRSSHNRLINFDHYYN